MEARLVVNALEPVPIRTEVVDVRPEYPKPVGPVGPVGPGAPVGPVGPVGPVAPCDPVSVIVQAEKVPEPPM
ncbi:hypothetical protein EBT31_21220 [bacterium]|nr:hypothetical protein [bacterium]